ncbi:MAG: hypothetical protein COA65_03650 [Rhodospirillaceae bacterium]|nr:MAG: hypothetical protein COA65_03650 [Rhodospirillaceae bacterium]
MRPPLIKSCRHPAITVHGAAFAAAFAAEFSMENRGKIEARRRVLSGDFVAVFRQAVKPRWKTNL